MAHATATTQQASVDGTGTLRAREKSPLATGVVAGLLGGMLMAAWSMSYAAVTGIGFFMPLKLIAATVHGVESLVGGPGVLLIGVLIHVVVAMGYGVLFALLLPRGASIGAGFLAGLAYGALILLFMTYIVLPLGNEIMRERVELIPTSWIVTHLIFGATVGLLVPALRRSTKATPQPHPHAEARAR